MKRVQHALLGLLLVLTAAAARAQNTAPSITAAAPVFLNAGGPGTSATIATVGDAEEDAGSLNVTADSVPSGISVSSIHNSAGTITATINIACDATAGANNVILMVTDSQDASAYATFVVNVAIVPAPPVPTITAAENGTGTSDQACPEQPLVLTASSAGASSYQWYNDNDTLNGETGSTYIATGRGNYTVTALNDCGVSEHSDAYVVQNPTPHRAFLSTVGSPTFCAGGSVTIWSDSATGIQWCRDGVAIPGSQRQRRRSRDRHVDPSAERPLVAARPSRSPAPASRAALP